MAMQIPFGQECALIPAVFSQRYSGCRRPSLQRDVSVLYDRRALAHSARPGAQAERPRAPVLPDTGPQRPGGLTAAGLN